MGKVSYVNPAFESLTGLSSEDVRGRAYQDIFKSDWQDDGMTDRLDRTFREAAAWSGRVRRKKADGSSADLDVAITPLHDQAGRVMNFSVTERDVTAEAQAERHVCQTQKMETLGTLAGGIAHDFNNILMTIGINAELAQFCSSEGSAQKHYLDLAIQAADRGKTLVKQIISFSRQKEEERTSSALLPTPAYRGHERILLVDDEEAVTQGVREMLEQLGYRVKATTSSPEALSLFEADPQAFDLVITDQTMPRMSGVKLAENLLAIRPELPVILCKGFSEAVGGEEARACGIRQFVMKPYTLQEIGAAIRRVFDRARPE